MRAGSLFAGIGGLDLGLERAGMHVAWQVEIDTYCRQVLARHWPDVRIYEDVKTVGKRNLEPVDLICGGFPCQDLSVVGKRAGLAGKRSGLWFEFERIARELRPNWLLIENVPGLLSSNEGADFALIVKALSELGYGVAWRILDSQYFGVAQRRRRLFIVGRLGSATSAGKVLFESESCSGDTAPSRKKGRVSAALSASGAGTSRTGNGRTEADLLITPLLEVGARTNSDGYRDGDGIGKDGDPMYTLQASKQHGVAFGYQGQGAEPDFLVSRTLKAKPAGGSHDVTQDTYIPVGYQGRPDLSHALRSQASRADKPSSSTYVAMGVSTNQRGEARLRDVHGSLTASWSGKQYDGVMVAPTLSTKNEVASSSTQRHAWMEQSAELFGAVRRLTPMECERLQGFPDGWTLIDDDTADTPRYRALGNAVTVPVAQWIGNRIVAQETEEGKA